MSDARRGFAAVEMLVAAALFVALLAICLQLAAASAVARRDFERRAVAQLFAANALEAAGTLNWSETTSQRLRELEQTLAVPAALPGGTLTLSLQEINEEPLARRINAEVGWPTATSGSSASTRLSRIIYQLPQGQP